MNIKKLSNYLIATSIIIGSNVFAEDINDKLQMVVILDSLGSRDILSGDFQEAAGKIENRKDSRRYKNSTFEVSMAACVAEYGISKLVQAEKSCTKAITDYEGKSDKEYSSLKSFALSNRSIVRYKMGDFDNSFKDIKLAVKIDDNKIVTKNLELLFPSKTAIESATTAGE
jgi:hypothetical protein